MAAHVGGLVLLRHKRKVIAGLDPAIHHLTKEMDPRVKPAVYAEKGFITGIFGFVTQ